jgi:hypothetical protein
MSFLDLTAASRFQFGQNLVSAQIGNLLFSSTALPFNMQPQTQTNWCWAATATSVSHFYFSGSSWTQCKVANGNLSLTVCCNSPVPGPCNVSSFLQAALAVTSNFSSMVNSTIGYDAILAELTAGRVVGARIGWSGGGGHFMVIYGCSRVGATQYLDIDDPIFGKSHPTLDEFTNRYQGNGHWTHTYYTKRWPTLKIKLPLLDAQLLSVIEQSRPLLALKQGDRNFALKSNSSLAVPHHVFVMSLQDIADYDEPPLSAPASLRVLEVEDGHNRCGHDRLAPAWCVGGATHRRPKRYRTGAPLHPYPGTLCRGILAALCGQDTRCRHPGPRAWIVYTAPNGPRRRVLPTTPRGRARAAQSKVRKRHCSLNVTVDRVREHHADA